MQKYKIVASKSQKKYTLVLSADSESQAKDKLHKDGYSILSIEIFSWDAIEWNKFIFQIQKDWEIKKWIIVGTDIFKAYVKLREELWYDVISLYPEWDNAEDDAKKKQEIIQELHNWYALQKKQVKIIQEKQQGEETFYMKKKLDETYVLINSAIEKFDNIFSNKKTFNIDDQTLLKLEIIYEKLIHIKSSTNIVKLREIGELALTKIGQIELAVLEESKNKQSRDLVLHTNQLLKKIGSNNQFIEEDKNIKKKISDFLKDIFWKVSLEQLKKDLKQKKQKNQLIDTNSYSFLKTILLLEKYKEKLKENTGEIQKNILLFCNPFSKSELKEKIVLKRKVIKQNISILKAKKSWWIGSYTWVKKGYRKWIEVFFSILNFISKMLFLFILCYFLIFFFALLAWKMGLVDSNINSGAIIWILFFICIFFVFSASKNLVVLAMNLVIFSFIFIFSTINF